MKLSKVSLFVLLVPVILPTKAILAQTVHVLAVADTNTNNGAAHRIDLDNIERTFRASIPAKHLQLVLLSGDEVSQENILGRIAQFQTAPGDALVFIWSGHGAHTERGHFLGLQGGPHLYRSTILAAMQKKGVRLVAMLTCSCNVFIPQVSVTVNHPRTVYYPPITPEKDKPDQISALFNVLFLRSRGVLDVNASSEGEYSFSFSEQGSLFLSAFCEKSVADQAKSVSWNTLLSELRPQVQREFDRHFPGGYQDPKSGKTYRTQTLKTWSLPSEDGYRPRFGIAITDNRGDGVRILEVGRNSPARKVRRISNGEIGSLEPADVILSVNNQPVHNMGQCVEAIERSPPDMKLTVRNGRDGAILEFTASLRSPDWGRTQPKGERKVVIDNRTGAVQHLFVNGIRHHCNPGPLELIVLSDAVTTDFPPYESTRRWDASHWRWVGDRYELRITITQ